MEMNESTNGSNVTQETENYFHFLPQNENYISSSLYPLSDAFRTSKKKCREKKKLFWKIFWAESVFLQKNLNQPGSIWVPKIESKLSRIQVLLSLWLKSIFHRFEMSPLPGPPMKLRQNSASAIGTVYFPPEFWFMPSLILSWSMGQQWLAFY